MPLKKRTFRSYDPAFDNEDSQYDRRRTEITQIGTVTAAHSREIFRAPSEVLIKRISIVVNVTIAASNSDYWTFNVVNVTKGSCSLFSTAPTTKAASLNGLTQNTNKDLTPDQNLYLTTDDVLRIDFTETGVTSNLQDCIVAIDWEVTGETTTTSSSTTTTTTTTTSTSSSTTTTTTTSTSTSTTLT